MNRRGYQDNFFRDHPKIQDLNRRQRKAIKIRFLLENFAKIDLQNSLCLDIGCSAGYVTQELAPLFRSIIGIEYDQEALTRVEVPKPFTNTIGFINGDAMALPFRDEALDIILCAQIYEHVPDDTLLAKEMFRVLRPGGMIFFSGPNQAFPIELHYNLPFLHWLPQYFANAYLRIFGKGDFFYERFRTNRGLRQLFSHFEIKDITLQVIRFSLDESPNKWILHSISKLPDWVLKLGLPIVPNFNWLLYKPMQPPQ